MAADDIGNAVLTMVSGTAEVTALTTRAYSDGHLPQNATLPAYTVDVITNNAIEHIGGTSVSVARVRIDAYAVDRASANTLAETIRQNAMQSTHKGLIGSLNVREISLTAGPYWEVDRPRDGSDRWRPIVRTDYLVTYVQTGPS